MLNRGGPRLYQKPAVTREKVARTSSGIDVSSMTLRRREVRARRVAAAVVLQFGFIGRYDELPLAPDYVAGALADENLAMQLTVESLIRPRFQRWLRDTLMQCVKNHSEIAQGIELAERNVLSTSAGYNPSFSLVNALGVRVAVTQAGLTLVAGWIKALNGITQAASESGRSIEEANGNQLLVQKSGRGSLRGYAYAGLRDERPFRAAVKDADKTRRGWRAG